MTFVKGQIANPKGRPKGTKNKTNIELAKRLKALLESNYEQIEEDLKQLSPSERVKAFSSLLAYVIPKQATISVEAKIQKEYEELERLLQVAPDEAVQEIAERVMKLQKLNQESENNE